ncbi:Uncharacterized protein APZ42_021309 [Daphnia magna]|uniref:Uncharacterized protein n=1 Tax=Daphnia magna TaxID=35525 RepID=A0A164WSV5_9CRUS|nr:Uncharacterized protein APZ42_021309 [Daphnia magna]
MRQSIRLSRVHLSFCCFFFLPCFHSTWIRLLMTEGKVSPLPPFRSLLVTYRKCPWASGACVHRETLGAALLTSVSLCVDAGQLGRSSS